MKNRLSFLIVIMIIVMLACSISYNPESQEGFSSITVDPHSGLGEFSASVIGKAFPGEISLMCFVPHKNGQSLLIPIRLLNIEWKPFHTRTYDFNEHFEFNVTEPGVHEFICTLNGEISWSGDFLVLQPRETEIANTPLPTPMMVATGTQTPVITLQGIFELPETNLTCSDGSQEPNAASVIKGTLEVSVNPSTGMASAIIEGTSGDVEQSSCGAKPEIRRYTIANSTIPGIFNPNTGELALSGEVTHSFWNSCYTDDGSTCTAGGVTDIPINMTLTGIVDPIKHIATGKINFGKTTLWGNWQAN